uniref:Endonuclease/exonuclease/phosphatase domain-containing protein n=1 Tax=Aegilops tauschii subsp. strangulata TaxID=200361 RepID=A0A453HUU9_AEGTS
MVAFRDALEVCGLVDLGFVGVPFTYDNKRSRASNVKVRLDRAVATNEWRNMFAFSSILHIPSPCSDHVAVLLKGSADPGPSRKSSRRYELFWERDAALPEVIKEAWAAVGGVQNLAQLRDALSKTMVSLGVWSKKFGNIRREIAKSRSQLEELMHMNADKADIRIITDRMNELLYQEEML